MRACDIGEIVDALNTIAEAIRASRTGTALEVVRNIDVLKQLVKALNEYMDTTEDDTEETLIYAREAVKHMAECCEDLDAPHIANVDVA